MGCGSSARPIEVGEALENNDVDPNENTKSGEKKLNSFLKQKAFCKVTGSVMDKIPVNGQSLAKCT